MTQRRADKLRFLEAAIWAIRTAMTRLEDAEQYLAEAEELASVEDIISGVYTRLLESLVEDLQGRKVELEEGGDPT